MKRISRSETNKIIGGHGLAISETGWPMSCSKEEKLNFCQLRAPKDYSDLSIFVENSLDWLPPTNGTRIINFPEAVTISKEHEIVLNRLIGFEFFSEGFCRDSIMIPAAENELDNFSNNVIAVNILMLIAAECYHAQILSTSAADYVAFEDGFIQFISASLERTNRVQALMEDVQALRSKRAAWYFAYSGHY